MVLYCPKFIAYWIRLLKNDSVFAALFLTRQVLVVSYSSTFRGQGKVSDALIYWGEL